ncbi:MAG: hypothetical protein D3926_15990 [Desulfobacteraceae bacterium]|nr:MAG: hypothetical protein D3926_15990 [Desulfobacteraceae bacterium]
MSYRIGVIKEIETDGYAQVETERKTVCGECENQKMVCYGCMFSPRIVGRVANPIGAVKGDRVKIYLSTKKLFMAAGLFYLVPMLALLLGAFSGLLISGAFDMSESAATLGFAIAGFLLGIIVVTFLGRTHVLSRFFQPVITGVAPFMGISR